MVRPPAQTFEVLAIRYGTRETTRSEVFHRYERYGEPDAVLDMDYFFWVLLPSVGAPVIIDSGFDPEVAKRLGRTPLVEPATAITELGINPATVECVIVTHLHYDHIGNLKLFPSARFVLARSDFEFWTGPMGTQQPYASLVVQDELAFVADARAAGRVLFMEDELELTPGIRLLRVAGHSPGQLSVMIDTPTGPCLLASDAVHYFEELDCDRPFALFTDLDQVRQGYATLRALIQETGAVLVPGHDPLVTARFPRHPTVPYAFNVGSPVPRGR